MTDKTQLEKFKELARESECDTDEQKFDEALKKVSKSPRTKETSDDNPNQADD